MAIGTRLKRAGMHWGLSGANTIIALRCSKLSGRFEDFWERRSRKVEEKVTVRTVVPRALETDGKS
ncbi:MAG: hypothetical protein DMG58_34495 [Acidobacteria bacterium]|nr:MAG: hypothetical protein DMG58_34495 [Acidobacteriota bacterium]